MAFTRITGLAVGITGIATMRLKKKDTGDSANTHASNTARVTPGAGTGAGTPIAGTWIYNPGVVGGGYTHYADVTLPDGYFNGRNFTVEARDTSGDSYEVYTGLAPDLGGGDVTLYTSSGSPPSAPTLTVGAVTSSSIGISWVPVAGATSYKLFYSADNVTFTPYGGTITSTNITVTGLAAATRYFFYGKATNGDGDSAASGTVNEITTSTGGGTATAVPSFTSLSSGNIKRHQFKYVISTEAFAVVNMELGVGGSVLTASANASGVCVITPTAKIPVDVSSVRIRAQAVGKTLSAWSSAVTVVDGANTDPWFQVFETEAGGTYEAYEVTFTGDPDSSPPLTKGAKISSAPRSTVALARADGFTYLESLL